MLHENTVWSQSAKSLSQPNECNKQHAVTGLLLISVSHTLLMTKAWHKAGYCLQLLICLLYSSTSLSSLTLCVLSCSLPMSWFVVQSHGTQWYCAISSGVKCILGSIFLDDMYGSTYVYSVRRSCIWSKKKNADFLDFWHSSYMSLSLPQTRNDMLYVKMTEKLALNSM